MGNACPCFSRETREETEEIPENGIDIAELNDSKALKITKFHESQAIDTKKASLKDFKLHKVLGKGAFGKVLLVEKTDTNELFAMKILSKKFLKEKQQQKHTKNELFVLTKVEHPFIIELFFAFQTQKKLYLVTEFAQGGELFLHLRRVYQFSLEKACFYAAQLVLVLEELHRNSVIYRDLKPENILLSRDGYIKLCDFGLCQANFDYQRDKAQTICGTFEYIAPEVLLGLPYDFAVDWWSMGVLVYEMLTGFVPFEKNELISVCQQQKAGKRREFAKNIKDHQFFCEIQWDSLLERKFEAPFRPPITNQLDLRNFDKAIIEENVQESLEPNSKKIGSFEIYSNFSYTREKIVKA